MFNRSRDRKIAVAKFREKLYSMSDVAKMLNCDVGYFYNEVRHVKSIPAPKRKMGNMVRKYYNEKDVREIMKLAEKFD